MISKKPLKNLPDYSKVVSFLLLNILYIIWHVLYKYAYTCRWGFKLDTPRRRPFRRTYIMRNTHTACIIGSNYSIQSERERVRDGKRDTQNLMYSKSYNRFFCGRTSPFRRVNFCWTRWATYGICVTGENGVILRHNLANYSAVFTNLFIL